MKIAWPIYFVAAVVAIVSFSIAHYLSEHELVATVIASPGVAALFGALFQIFRDYAAFERARALQNENNDFILSATSHMANVAFDKHVAFAEKYLKTVQKESRELFCIGPTEHASDAACDAARKLFEVREEFGAWITSEIRKELEPFEQELAKLHANAGLLPSLPVGAQRSKAVEALTTAYKTIADIKDPGEKEEAAKAGAIQLKENLQTLLGIPELTLLRRRYIERAMPQPKTSKR